jgi:hypothetical protein
LTMLVEPAELLAELDLPPEELLLPEELDE